MISGIAVGLLLVVLVGGGTLAAIITVRRWKTSSYPEQILALVVLFVTAMPSWYFLLLLLATATGSLTVKVMTAYEFTIGAVCVVFTGLAGTALWMRWFRKHEVPG